MSLSDIQKAIAAAVRKAPHPEKITRVRLFGSYLHDKAGPASDIDLLIEIERPMGLFEFFDIEQSLTHELGRPVDLTTPDGLSKHIRSQVLTEAATMYEKS